MMRCLPTLALLVFMGLGNCPLVHADELREAYDQYKALNEAGKYQEALPFAQEALRLGAEQFGETDKSTAVLLNNLGSLYHELGDYAKAEPLLKRALEISEKSLGPDHPDVAIRLNNLGSLYRTVGDYAKSEPLLKRALEIWEKALGRDHQQVATALNNLGSLYDNLGDYAKAEPLYERALEISKKALGPDHPAVAIRLNNLGLLYDNLGDYAKAEPLYKLALEILEKALGSDHPGTKTVSNTVSGFLKRHGLRRWTDSTGRYSREAHFVGLKDEEVSLMTTNGNTISIQLEKLSEADQEYTKVAQELIDSDGATDDEDPFK